MRGLGMLIPTLIYIGFIMVGMVYLTAGTIDPEKKLHARNLDSRLSALFVGIGIGGLIVEAFR